MGNAEKEEHKGKPAALGGEKRKLKFLFVSIDALIGDLAWDVKQDGHEVK